MIKIKKWHQIALGNLCFREANLFKNKKVLQIDKISLKLR